jgi:hypothetical protein
LLDNFFLSPTNDLPSTYQDLGVIMKYIRIEYHSIDACTNYHIIYYGKYALETKFPQYQINRYQTNQVTNKCASQISSQYSHNPKFAMTIQVPKHSTFYRLPCMTHK